MARTSHRLPLCLCHCVLCPQALSEERASAIEQLQLQLDLANEKVAVVSAELAHLEQEGRQVREIKACVRVLMFVLAC